jgi:uncharacterized membrane protein
VYAVAVAAIGGLLVAGEFVFIWAPIPEWVPGAEPIARIAGAVMLVAALGLCARRTVIPASVILIAVLVGWLLLQASQLVQAPAEELLWSGAGQLVALVAGSWLLLATARGKGLRIARAMYALALPLMGLHHFLADGAVGAIPAGLPFPAAWLYATGAAHIAAGVAILVGIVPRLAATLEAIMIAGFVLLVHVPGVIGDPRDPMQWTMLIAAAAIDGAAWIVARSY